MFNYFAQPAPLPVSTDEAASFPEKFRLTRKILTQNIAHIVHDLPPGKSLVRLDIFGSRIWVVRQAHIMNRLAYDQRLDRGWSHGGVREVFGHDTLFLLPRGALHADRKRELKSHLTKDRVTAMVPDIANLAAAMVENIAADAGRPVNMQGRVLQYLFPVAAMAIAGVAVDLDIQVRDFQQAFEKIMSTASSSLRMALSGLSTWLAACVAGEGRQAVRSLYPIGEKLIHAACEHTGPSLIHDLLRRHGWEPAAVDCKSVFPDALLNDASMSFAAAVFTTSHLMVSVVDYYSRHPAELQTLRQSIAQDFPNGVRGATQLLSTPTARALLPVMVQQSPVGLVVRDVMANLPLIDEDGLEHPARKGDVVIFDMAAIQQSSQVALKMKLADMPAGAALIDILDARNNDALTAFFSGAFQCPGRPLAVTDALFFLIEALGRLDCRFLVDPPITRSLVHYFGGSPSMNITPLQTTAVETAIHAQLHPPPCVIPDETPPARALPRPPIFACPHAARASRTLGI